MFLEGRRECFPNTLLFFLLLSEFILNSIKHNRTWRLRTENRKKHRTWPPLQIAVGAPGWGRIALGWRGRWGTVLRQSLGILGCADHSVVDVCSESINGIQHKEFLI